jgi:hypothetical protein
VTLPPERIGDKGQRYEVRATGYPKKEESVIGWHPDLDGAARMARAIRSHPCCTSTVIWDRHQNVQVIRSYAGTLR